MKEANNPLILAYHSISNSRRDNLTVNALEFEMQLDWLKSNNYQKISLNDLPVSNTKNKMLIITFDDGYEDNYSIAFPLLMKYGFNATIFITADYTGTDHIFWWDKNKIGKYGEKNDFRLLDWNQVSEMKDCGIEFGSHTNKHRLLTDLSEKQARFEIEESKIKISRSIGSNVYSFCYPAGRLNDSIINMVKEAGYKCGVITAPVRGIPESIYTYKRVGIYHNTSFLKFKLKIRPNFQKIIEMTKRKKYLK